MSQGAHARTSGSWLIGLLLLAAASGGQSPLEREVSRDRNAASRMFLQAERLESAGDLEAALRDYQLLLEQFPASEVAEEASLRIARDSWQLGRDKEARRVAQELIDSSPRSPAAAGAFVLLGQMDIAAARAPSDLERARNTLRRVPALFGADAFPALGWRSEARVLTGEVCLRLGDDGEAAAAFLAASEGEPISPLTARAQLGLAKVLLRQGEWIAAAEVLQRAISASEPSPWTSAGRLLLTLVHRHFVRPESGEARWRRARTWRPGGLELEKPAGIAATPEGGLIVAEENARVRRFEADGTESAGSNISGLRPWHGLDGTSYVATDDGAMGPLIGGERRVFQVPDRSGGKERPARILAGERGAFGEWYLIDAKRRQVLAFDPDGRYWRALDQAGSEPVDLARDDWGRIYILDADGGSVSRLEPDQARAEPVATGGWKKPRALAVDSVGNLYVLDAATRQISIMDSGGARIATLGPRLPGGIELERPEDLTVDATARLFVADRKLAAIVVVE